MRNEDTLTIVSEALAGVADLSGSFEGEVQERLRQGEV